MSKINETNYPRRPQSDYEDTDMLIIQEAGGNTYTTRIEDIREDCQETIAPTVEAVNDALAPPENGSTASQSYAIGEHFMRNGNFCTAIAAITSGASFTLNTNYVVGTIAEALESLTSDLADKTPTIYETTVSNVTTGNSWGSLYYAVATVSTGAKDWRGKKIQVSFVPDSTSYTTAFAVIDTVSNGSIAIMLVRPNSATLNGKAYAYCYE